MKEYNNSPLASRIRPKNIDEIVGQSHLFGANGTIRKMMDRDHMTNLIFYGPSGTGKTTAANIIAEKSNMTLCKLNATTSGLADIREVTEQTKTVFGQAGILLYLDEIQYLNKKQQQSLLEFIEDGRITLIASTTENPYIYIYSAILSRSAVLEFKPLSETDLKILLKRALYILNEENQTNKTAEDGVIDYIAACGAGDARRALNLLENAFYITDEVMTVDEIKAHGFKSIGSFDGAGVVHYDMLSALQKSIRGSDPDAALFYLAKILKGGDLIGACRRLQVIAAEDIGLAYPQAIAIVKACTDCAFDLGMPEAQIPLADAAVLLATAPKSNSAYLAMSLAMEDVENGKGQVVPPHLRPSNSFDGYLYPHDFPAHYVKQQYLPDDLINKKYYSYSDNKNEQAAKLYWDKIKNKNE